MLSNSAKVKNSLKLRLLSQQRRCEGFIQPGPEISIDKEIHSQQRGQIRQRPSKLRFHLEVLQNQHGNQCGPNLNVKRIGRCADEGFDPEVLLEGFKEKLDLPSVFVYHRYR